MSNANLFAELKDLRERLGTAQGWLDRHADLKMLEDAGTKIAEAISLINDELENEPL
jgi:hypothetical protein